MGLISGLVLGIMFGVALIMGWKHMMDYRHKKRIAKVVIHFPCFENLMEFVAFGFV